MDVCLETAVNEWHASVNAGDLPRSAAAVGDRVVWLGNGIDQSGASRLVTSASASGHLVMAASTADARRREASLTPTGRSMLDRAHQWQEDVFARLTADWREAQRRDFQQAMADLMDRSYAL